MVSMVKQEEYNVIKRKEKGKERREKANKGKKEWRKENNFDLISPLLVSLGNLVNLVNPCLSREGSTRRHIYILLC